MSEIGTGKAQYRVDLPDESPVRYSLIIVTNEYSLVD